MSDHASTQELIAKIEKKDKRFRLFQTLFMVGTFIALIFIISALNNTLNTVRGQVAAQEKTNNETRKARDEQLASITRRLDCMVVFFSTPNRERDNLTIENVETCVLNKDQDLNKFFKNEPNNSSENPPNLPDSSSSATQENAEEQSGNDQKDTDTKKQVYILGIPVCVPFTNVCVEQ